MTQILVSDTIVSCAVTQHVRNIMDDESGCRRPTEFGHNCFQLGPPNCMLREIILLIDRRYVVNFCYAIFKDLLNLTDNVYTSIFPIR